MTIPAQPQASPPSDAIDLRAYLRPIWRRKLIILAIAVLAGVATYLISSSETKRYVASTRLYVLYSNPAGVVDGQAPVTPGPQNLADIATLLQSASRAQAVYAQLKLPVDPSNTVQASPQTGSSFIVLVVTSNSPTTAAELANTYARQFIATQTRAALDEAKLLHAQAETSLRSLPGNNPSDLQLRYSLLTQLRQLDATLAAPGSNSGVQQVDPAFPPGVPSSPKPVRDTIFALIIGLVVGIAIVFGLELLDRRLILVSTLESLYQRTVLAVLPHAADPAPASSGLVQAAPEHIEAVRTLMVNIGVEDKQNAWKTLLVTSAMPSEGKSTIARALALAYASAGRRTLVIDADLRRPTMNASFGISGEPGLSDVLRDKVALAKAAHGVAVALSDAEVETAIANGRGRRNGASHRRGGIYVLPHGEPIENPVALLSSPAWPALLEQAAESYDMVIIDSAPILTVADTIPLIDHVDMVLLVTRLGLTTRESASRVTALFRRVTSANLVGLVANDMRDQFLDEGYATYRSYAYRAGNGKRPRERARRPTRT